MPSEPSASLPVMVYVHGGGFVSGNGTDDNAHGPDFIVEKNVILVGFNYRLGILGFLSLDRKEAPGNMGLRDQIQALKWIQQNIKSFGGDPNNVTIFGISAGSASIEYLMLSPMAKGLFHKAILQSGSSLNPWTFKDNIKDLAFKIPLLKGKHITDEEELYQYLKNMPLLELMTSSMLALATDTQYEHKCSLYFGFVPTIEKPKGWEPVIDKPTYSLLKSGNFAKIPTIMGFCSHEGFLIDVYLPNVIQELIKEKEMVKWLPFDIDDVEKGAVEAKLKALYLDGNTTQDLNDFAIDFLGDVEFFGGIYTAANLISKASPAFYFYRFAYDGGLNYLKKKLDIERKGACHGDDGGYLVKSKILSDDDISETDKLVRNRMVHMWTSFAKTGNPTPACNDLIKTKWDAVAETGFNYLEIDDTLTMKEQFEHPKAKYFQELYSKYNTK